MAFPAVFATNAFWAIALAVALAGRRGVRQDVGMSSTPVTVDTFVRAETDKYFATPVNQAGGLGRFFHYRQPMPIDDQTVIRANRDTLYSAALIDLEAGPATVTLPDAHGRFLSLMVIDEDHYVPAVFYDPGDHVVDTDLVPTRYAMLGVRILVDPADPDDIATVHALQDEIRIEQERSGSFEVPDWDEESRSKIRDALLVLSNSLSDTDAMFGARGEVDPVRHLIGSASAWGGNPRRDATYFPVTPEDNDGTTNYRLVVGDVPVDGFWSIAVYNARGYFEPNALKAYSLNSVTATKEPDGSTIIQFGGSPADAPNVLPITPGWNYWVRLYRPRPEVLTGEWEFPRAMPLR
ncbi:DUF1254 domain-containing protein [Microbacterium paraoxydans]|uniref:DUF1254 domain-containing protein n=1 Tax=Microbacterium paraoxydans TaxID=199592 RepID=UPI00217D51E1|nr:DUF1254 domain-containing protein [Microbacterium paraoxydans]